MPYNYAISDSQFNSYNIAGALYLIYWTNCECLMIANCTANAHYTVSSFTTNIVQGSPIKELSHKHTYFSKHLKINLRTVHVHIAVVFLYS